MVDSVQGSWLLYGKPSAPNDRPKRFGRTSNTISGICAAPRPIANSRGTGNGSIRRVSKSANVQRNRGCESIGANITCLVPAQVSYAAAPIAAAATIAAAAAQLKTAREVNALKRQRAAAMAADV